MSEREPTVIAKTVTRIVVPLIIVTALALLIQGHNRPGGGFIAGVLTATAFALTYVIYGLDYIRRELLDQPETSEEQVDASLSRDLGALAAVGLLIAAGGGIVAMALGFPFLSQAVVFLEGLPIYHELEVARAFVFDLGVYFVVVGAILTILGVVGLE